MFPFDPSHLGHGQESRAITFENPTGARGAGGTAHGGRKGAPNRRVQPGEVVVLADIEGPATVRHVWMTFPPAAPDAMRAVWLEAYYDDAAEPSIAVPAVDFFGLPHGRPVPYVSALTACQEGRGFSSWVPMPFAGRLRLELHNAAPEAFDFFYQLDYTLEPSFPADTGYLHVSFRRENPTVMQRDFTIADGFTGPGRFIGCAVGVRVLDEGLWYGEGEVKVFLDGDRAGGLPTICGTGLEDYVGTAWGMGAHAALYGGAPLSVRPEGVHQPDWVGFYRWHVPDPVLFADDLRVTIQQIGFAGFREGEEDAFERYREGHPVAGPGWTMHPNEGVLAIGIAERVDDYCAAAFVSCREPQGVLPLDIASATADLALLPYEVMPKPWAGA
ncbi:MAG TPA: glycoside hydrolase family 172 protein [Acidimicrobiales bacterium]|nr:glycoside hydrolase family 172 protein [Acidimicrobiales bacterium]